MTQIINQSFLFVFCTVINLYYNLLVPIIDIGNINFGCHIHMTLKYYNKKNNYVKYFNK